MLRTSVIVIFLFVGMVAVSFIPTSPVGISGSEYGRAEKKIAKTVLRQIRDFQTFIQDSLYNFAMGEDCREKELQRRFLKSRLLYKKFEWAVEYFTGDLAKRLNGPPVGEIENADLLDKSMAFTIQPTGLQMIEPFLFPHYDADRKDELIKEIELLLENSQFVISYYEDVRFSDWRIWDAAKLEVFRILALGISGFDNPLSLRSMEETSVALASLRPVLSFYVSGKGKVRLVRIMDSAIDYLNNHPDFDSFDRAFFITEYGNSITREISALQERSDGYTVKYNRMLNQEAGTMFDKDAFNVNAFSPGPAYRMDSLKVKLGEKLFFDVSLSGTGTRSCASCHKPELGFADGLAKNVNIHDPDKLLTRNSPTLLNAALQSNYFYDMRALTLEDQAKDVIANPDEMDGSMEQIIRYLSENKEYQQLFYRAYPGKEGSAIEPESVTNALASYIRSLTKLNSRFDEYMRGNPEALTKKEIKGFNLFMGKAKCATCHFMPVFSGIMPPKFVESETEVIGVPVSLTDSTLDPDGGYYDIIGIDSYKRAFKTPTLRNIDKTAPYMHNGAYQTLEQVMEFYNNAGAVGLKIKLPNNTLSEDKLDLSQEEIYDIIAFMRSLSSR